MRNSLLLITLFASLSIALYSGCNSSHSGTEQNGTGAKVKYQCPMDCESGKVYDKPGKCPVCEMDMEVAPEQL